MTHKNSLQRNINMKDVPYWGATIIGATLQNRFDRDLCTPAVLVCIEWSSKGTEIILLQLTNLATIKLVCIPAQKGKIPKCLRFIDNRILLTAKENDIFLQFFFQLAAEGIERAVYKKVIAPFKNDLPASHLEGFRRVCADHKYAYFGPNAMNTIYSLSLSCQPVPLPDTSYRDQLAFLISKNSSYKGVINWRWENKIS